MQFKIPILVKPQIRQALDNRLYLEAGTGVDNIFKLLTPNLVWRLLSKPLPVITASRLGIFGSIKIQL